jgi:phospholipid/cholesterol/gamma-HCH transport system substrate-binding protein
MQQRKIDIWVGLFVAIGVTALIALTLSVGAKGWQSKKATYTVTANFAGIGTLKLDAPVKMVGIEIGRVRDISLIDDGGEYKAKVTMDIHRDVKLPKDSQVMVYTAGLLGAQFIGINQGVDAANLVEDGGQLTETEQAMQLEDLIKNFGVKQAESNAADKGATQ